MVQGRRADRVEGPGNGIYKGQSRASESLADSEYVPGDRSLPKIGRDPRAGLPVLAFLPL